MLPGLVLLARPPVGVLRDLLRLEFGQPLIRQGGLLRCEDVDAREVPVTPIVGDLFIVQGWYDGGLQGSPACQQTNFWVT